MVVIFAEVMPKTWALLRADRVALMLAPSIVVTLAILGPMARAVAWISRFFLSLLGVRVDRTPRCRGACRRAARRHRAARPGQERRDGAGREGDAALGARSRRPHGGRRHDPSRQRRADRRRPADRRHRRPRCWRRPTRASRSIATEPDNIIGVVHAKDLFRAVKAAGGPATVKIDDVMTPALVHSRIDDRCSTSSRRSAPATSISPSWSTNTARCAAS